MSDALAQLEESVQREDLKELRDEDSEIFIAKGRTIRAGLQQITHGDLHPRDFDVDHMRAWLQVAWSTQSEITEVIQAVAEGESAPVALEKVRMGRWVMESGLSHADAGRELARRVDAGEPMPWDP